MSGRNLLPSTLAGITATWIAVEARRVACGLDYPLGGWRLLELPKGNPFDPLLPLGIPEPGSQLSRALTSLQPQPSMASQR